MDDNTLKFSRWRLQAEPKEEKRLRPLPDNARWVAEQWRKRVDGELLAGMMIGSAATSRSAPDLMAEFLAKNFPRATERDEAFARLVERFQATRIIRYIASPSIPDRDGNDSTAWYWEQAGVFLIAPAWVPQVRQQFEAVGYTMVEVDEAWWQLTIKTLTNNLFPDWWWRS